MTYYQLFKSDGMDKKVLDTKFNSYEDAYDLMVRLYNSGSRVRWGIQMVSVSNYGGTTNTMIQPVWG